LTDLIKELSKTLTELRERENHPKENYQELSSGRSQPDDLSGQNKSRPISPRRLASEQAPFLSPSADTITEPAEYCINDAILHQEKIPDQLKENEARIDKLERLEAGEKNTRRNVLEGDSLKVKIEAQRQGEIEHLSQLKNGKWW
jgi:hypothetical protein